jgi:small subunit ribosomal protein S8
MYYDLLARIKNAMRAKKESLVTPYSKMDFAVLKILEESGYIKSASKKEGGKKNFIEVKLAYENGRPRINDFKILSKPSRRLYTGYKELTAVRQGEGLAVLSTPQGIMSNRSARKNKVGGEYLFQIW